MTPDGGKVRMFHHKFMTATTSTNLITKPTGVTTPTLTLNCVNLVGRAGANPDVQYFESGAVKATLSMAVRQLAKNANPHWFAIELWGKEAEIAANYIGKGDQFGISGYLKIETWIDRTTGCDRSKPVIKADRIYLLGNKRSDSNELEEIDAF